MGRKHQIKRGTPFWDRLAKQSGGCWEYQGCRNKSGYGRLQPPGQSKTVLAHRYAYELTYGPIPDGLFICHACDNPSCCNPAHLRPGTNSDNVQDAMQRGRRRLDWPGPVLRGEKNPSAKLTDAQTEEIRAKKTSGKYLQRDLAREYGVSEATISMIVNGHRRTGG